LLICITDIIIPHPLYTFFNLLNYQNYFCSLKIAYHRLRFQESGVAPAGSELVDGKQSPNLDPGITYQSQVLDSVENRCQIICRHDFRSISFYHFPYNVRSL